MSYSIKEIIDIAVGIEDDGYNYYKDCADAFKDNEEVNHIFTFLAEEELKHKKIFTDMKPPKIENKGIFTNEYYQYLNSINSERIFNDQNEVIASSMEISTPGKAIKKGFQDEKESILLYLEMMRLYKPEDEAYILLDKIIAEERQHVITLMKLMDSINLGNS